MIRYDDSSLIGSLSNARVCYMCGGVSLHLQIVEPLLLPTCASQECWERAAELPAQHCSLRMDDGRLCGVSTTQIKIDGRRVCAWHSRQFFERARWQADGCRKPCPRLEALNGVDAHAGQLGE